MSGSEESTDEKEMFKVSNSGLTKERRKQWTNEQIKSAMESVNTARCGVNKATRMHCVPVKTLKDRISKWNMEQSLADQNTYNDEEKEFADF